jgi:hypothetical protein
MVPLCGEEGMKRTFWPSYLLTALAALCLILATERVVAQDDTETQAKTQIKVKVTQVVNGVVVVDIFKGAKRAELQCNDGQPTCKTLKAGEYSMVELPKNFGMYDCQNAEVYPRDKENPDAADRIGAYCLIEK